MEVELTFVINVTDLMSENLQQWESSEFGSGFCGSSRLLTSRKFLLRGDPNPGASESSERTGKA